MGFGQAVKTCLFHKYFVFSGRATRSEFWWFSLFCLFALIAGVVVTIIVVEFIDPIGGRSSFEFVRGMGWFFTVLLVGFSVIGVISLFLIIPAMAVMARRLHDIGWSGWWCLLYAVLSVIFYYLPIFYLPLVGMSLSFVLMLVAMVILVRVGDVGPNRFGADPLRPDHSSDIFA